MIFAEFYKHQSIVYTLLCNKLGDTWLFTRNSAKSLPAQTKVHQVDLFIRSIYNCLLFLLAENAHQVTFIMHQEKTKLARYFFI